MTGVIQFKGAGDDSPTRQRPKSSYPLPPTEGSASHQTPFTGSKNTAPSRSYQTPKYGKCGQSQHARKLQTRSPDNGHPRNLKIYPLPHFSRQIHETRKPCSINQNKTPDRADSQLRPQKWKYRILKFDALHFWWFLEGWTFSKFDISTLWGPNKNSARSKVPPQSPEHNPQAPCYHPKKLRRRQIPKPKNIHPRENALSGQLKIRQLRPGTWTILADPAKSISGSGHSPLPETTENPTPTPAMVLVLYSNYEGFSVNNGLCLTVSMPTRAWSDEGAPFAKLFSLRLSLRRNILVTFRLLL